MADLSPDTAAPSPEAAETAPEAAETAPDADRSAGSADPSRVATGSPADGSAPSTDATDPSTLDLPDGRTLAYAEYGAADGVPVLAFHGVLGSRLTWALFDDRARAAGVRVVAPDRPGFGHSDFQRGRRLPDWPADVRALADHLGIDRFGLVGFSAGGPHAAAVAQQLPERVRGLALVSTVTPPATHHLADPCNDALLSATRFVPGFSLSAFGTAAWLARYARPQFRAAVVATHARPDRALFDGPVGDHLVDDAVEAFRRGGRGPAHDLPLVGGDWGFDPGDVDVPVAMFHGAADATVGIDMARAFGDLLPACDLYVGEAAHYSTLVGERERVLAAVADER